ncbi:glycosyl hydrolase family 95 catalytic domain-containing protein [Streptomyces sp. DW26H14]|uniref:glycosyl hydrolase family 95 catalytic domain-containing protein n=1 Tax=Streptomyces sp. DW26H14 TaxID=3435395 RepID=UPI00403D9FC7
MSRVSRRGFLQLTGGAAATGVAPLVGANPAAADGRTAAEAASSRPRPGPAAAGPSRGAVSTSWTENWESGFVTGNGDLGAVLYGRPEAPVLLVNNSRLYTSQLAPEKRTIAETAALLPELRRKITDEGYLPMMDWSWEQLQSHGLSPAEAIDYHPGLFLRCALSGADRATDYRRTEDFATGEIETTWRGSAGAFRTRCFASRADNVVVLSLTGPGKAGLTATLTLDPVTDERITPATAHGSDWTGFHNLYAPGNGGYDGAIRAVVRGGTVSFTDGALTISGADEAILLVRIDRWRPPGRSDLTGLAASLHRLAPDYERLLRPHAALHGALFDRAGVDFGGAPEDRAKTTDELLSTAMKEGTLNLALLEKIYDAQRYLVLSSSGHLPPNLQGIWNGLWSPPWHSDFSTDANLELAIDATMSANMPELMAGFFDLVEAGVPSWREGARKLAGCRGILYPARMQDQGTYFQQTHDWQWFNQVSIAGWLGHYFYDYYRYTGDRTFLRNRAIPYLKECALFYEDWYVMDPDGTLRSTPSFSYESALADNATIDFAVAREVLTNLVEGCELLGVEHDGVPRWKALLGRMPDYMINTAETAGGTPPPMWRMDGGVPSQPDGTLKEFINPHMYEFPPHRHMSPLYPLFVSYEFAPDATPELWTAAEKLYEKKIANVTESESHYRMQSSLCAARLGRGDDVWNFLNAMTANNVFHTSLVPSHYDNLNTFNVDATGGIQSVLHNCLFFSLPGRFDLLPALPRALSRGTVRGVLARGRLTVRALSWDLPAGTLSARLESGAAQRLEIAVPPRLANAVLTVDGRRQRLSDLGAGRRGARVSAKRGTTSVELRFDSVPDQPVSRLLSLGADVTVSSTRTSDGDVGASHLTDGDATTRWTSEYADGQWVRIDLGAVHDVNDVKLTWEAATGKDYDIEVSADGHTWSTVKSVAGNTASGLLDYPGIATVARYVRLDLKTRATAYGFSLYEVRVYGS